MNTDSLVSQPSQRRRLRAPTEDGKVFADPPWETAAAIVDANRPLAMQQHDFQGRCRCELARQARHELLHLARDYTCAYRNAPPLPKANEPVLLAGHQPALFHPGVWFKNFALASLADSCHGVGVNLLIDNDAVAPTSIRVPAGSANQPRLESVVYDKHHPSLSPSLAPSMPLEERSIQDFDTFRSFGARVKNTIAHLIDEPFIDDYWPAAVEAGRRDGRLGAAIAQARHQWEGKWGLETYEAPLASVCESEPFYWFAAHLLANLPRFAHVYNSTLDEYRQMHRLRSRAHPAADLSTTPQLSANPQLNATPEGASPWREAPFWVWSVSDPQRRKLFVRQNRCCLELSDRRHWRTTLPLSPESTANHAVEQLASLAENGMKLRPRALITTMYARLFLGDLFLHGIGGAKYDEVTDRIVERFFGLTPPKFMALSATMYLPLPRPNTTDDQVRRAATQLRQMWYHPERFLSASQQNDPEILDWVDRKSRAVASQPVSQSDSSGLEQRHREIEQANQSLRRFIAEQRQSQTAHLEQLHDQRRRAKLWGSREFAFPLFPTAELRATLTELSGIP